MRRPTSIVGLLSAAAFRYPGRVAAVAIGATLAWLAVTSRAAQLHPATSRMAGCDVYEHWRAGLHLYDHLDSVDLERRTRGETVRGDSQSVHSITRFAVRPMGEGEMEWSRFVEVDPYTGEQRPIDRPPVRLRYHVDAGEFVVVEPEPGRQIERTYGCRLRFEQDDPGHDYFARRIRERPLQL